MALTDWPGALSLGQRVPKGTEQHRNLDHFTEDRRGHSSAFSPALDLPSGRDARHCCGLIHQTQHWARGRRGERLGPPQSCPDINTKVTWVAKPAWTGA